VFLGIHVCNKDCPSERDADGNFLPMLLNDDSPAWKSLQASDKLPLHNTQSDQLGTTLTFWYFNNDQSASLLNFVQRNGSDFHI